MDTAMEALFKAMLNDGWFTESDGSVDSPTGYFGWTLIQAGDVKEILDAFDQTVSAHGTPENIVGVWYAWINSDGIIRYTRIGDIGDIKDPYLGIPNTPNVQKARNFYNQNVRTFGKWMEN